MSPTPLTFPDHSILGLVTISSGVVFGRDNQTTALLCTLVDGLNNVDEFLLILQDPVEFVVVASAKVTHHVLVAEEEHEGDCVVEFVHLFEVRYLVEVADIDDSKVLDAVGNFVEHFVLFHAVWIPVSTKADDNQALVLGEDGLINVPCRHEMRDDNGTHDEVL
jgi:hypothetical protein